MSEEQAEIEYIKPSFEVNKLTVHISEVGYSFQILKAEKCLFIWIGAENDNKLVDLSLALPTAYDQTPVVTNILGDSVTLVSSNLAKRISKVLKKPVYISCNIAADRLLLPLIEKSLAEQIKNKPELF